MQMNLVAELLPMLKRSLIMKMTQLYQIKCVCEWSWNFDQCADSNNKQINLLCILRTPSREYLSLLQILDLQGNSCVR